MQHDTCAKLPRDGTLPETRLETAAAFFFLRRNIVLTAISKMSGYAPFSSPAHAVASTEIGHRPYAPISGFGADPLQHELPVHNGNFSTPTGKIKFTRATFVTVVLLTVTAAVGFLVLQCFRALTPGRSAENHGVTSRRLAEKGGTSCSVGHCVERPG